MKARLMVSVLLCTLSAIPSVSFAADPCEVALCMYGKATGNSGGDSCQSAEHAFFDIVKSKPYKTENARREFLGECSTFPAEFISTVIQKFGRA